MSKYVPDILSRRWVIIAPDRTNRPDDTKNISVQKSTECPFCPGNEEHTKGEVFRIGEGDKDKPGWKVRVIPNKYPITDFHEVIIHTTDDTQDVEDLPLPDVENVFKAYRERFNFYKDKGEVLIFCNHGEHAGASIKHAHSQLVVIPSQINLDELSREPLHNIVEETELFTLYCPDFSQWPYEVWVAPKREEKMYGDITDEEIAGLSQMVQKTLRRLQDIHKVRDGLFPLPWGYNYYIYPKENWYLRIIPRFVHRAGFELGTGLSVNIIDPVEAALELRGEKDKVNEVLEKLKNF